MALLITEREVALLLTMEPCIDVVEAALQRQAEGCVLNHPRRRFQVPDGTFHFMEAADLGLGRMAIKAYSSFRPATRFLVLLYDTTTGDLLAMIEADRLGQMRTGAATGVATRHMAREDAAVLGMMGSGWQAETQALAVAAVRSLREIRVFSRSPEKREEFARRMGEQLGIASIAAASAQEAVSGADVVVTATTSRTPVLEGAWLSPGAHVNAVGSNMLSKAEIDIGVVSRAARVVVDSVEQSKMEAGDLLGAIEARKLRWEQVRELGQVVAGFYPGRETDDEITLFKSNGIALEDVAAASLVYDRAREQGIGIEVPLWT